MVDDDLANERTVLKAGHPPGINRVIDKNECVAVGAGRGVSTSTQFEALEGSEGASNQDEEHAHRQKNES